MIEMRVMGIALDTRTGSPIVVLNDKENRKALPIWIGSAEASAIIRKIENIPSTRPLTHDLFIDIAKQTNSEYVYDKAHNIITVGNVELLLIPDEDESSIYGFSCCCAYVDELDELDTQTAMAVVKSINDRCRQQIGYGALARQGIYRMGYLTTLVINIVAAIVARSRQRTITHRDDHLAVLSGVHIAVVGRIDRNAPRAPLRVATTADNLTSDLDHIIGNAHLLDLGRNAIDRITLGYRVEIEAHTRIALDDSTLLDPHLLHSDKLQQRVHIGLLLRHTARKAISLGQRCNRHIVHTPADRIHATRQRDHLRDMPIDRVGRIAIDATHKRGRIEDRHRGGHLGKNILGSLPDFGHTTRLGTRNNSVGCADAETLDTHILSLR